MSSDEIAEYLEEVKDIKSLSPGDIIRRIGNDKVQQGGFVKLTDEADGVILVNVLDLVAPGYAAEFGAVRTGSGDKLYRHTSSFKDSGVDSARNVLTNWTLYREHPEIHSEMLEMLESAYSPEHILELKADEQLTHLFIPMQQKFQIGKFKEKVDWDKVRTEQFRERIGALHEGKHITYVAFIPRDTNHMPMFFSNGTKPHLETVTILHREPFSFKPNQGGHMKRVSAEGEKPKFVVDAGSNDLGSGIHTSVAIAELVTDNLSRLYPEFEYVPLPGRDAYGVQQSY